MPSTRWIRATRGATLLIVVALLGAACANAPTTRAGDEPGPQIVDAAGAPVSRERALAAMRAADHVLLGEAHDNPIHHRERARLLAALADRRPAVVFEQFARDADAALAAPVDGAIDAWLDRAGFDRRGWAWPLHRPLIDAALAAGLPLRGGNLSREQVRRVAREGIGAAPPDLQELLRDGLPADAARVLDEALREGHCGKLPASMLPGLRQAQMTRDAAMADALARAAGAEARPTVLIAGNGHARRDHGVPLWLARLRPGARVLSVGFVERGADAAPPPSDRLAVYDLAWITARVERDDPCATLAMPPSR